VIQSERRHRVRTGLLKRVPAAAVGLGFFAALWPFVRLDFDRNHDGYMLTVAIAHHAGLDLHREVASQYGPLPTWTQELFLHLPIAPAFALRIWTVLLLAGTAAVITDLGRVAPQRWRLNLWTSSGAAVVWALMCDRWLGITLHPWSSVLAAFLTAVAMHCWVHAEARIDRGQAVHARRLFTLAGVAIGLTPFARINVGLAAIIGTWIVALLTSRVRETQEGSNSGQVRILRSYSRGLVVGLVLPLLRLGWTGSIGAYIEQSILTPLEWSGSSDWQPRAYLEGAFGEILPLVAILVIAIAVISWIGAQATWSPRRALLKTGIIRVLATTLVTLGAGLATVQWFAAKINTDAANNSLIQKLTIHEWGAFTTFFLDIGLVATTATAIGLAALYIRALLGSRRLDSEVIAMMIAGALGLAGLTQIYPTHDSRHIWWGLPLGLLAVAWGLQHSSRSASAGAPLIALVSLLALTATSGWVTGRGVERFNHSSTISSAGFRSSTETVGAQVEDVKLLERTVGHSMPTLFYVYDHDLPSLLGHRPLPDENVIADRGFIRPTLSSRLTTRPALIVDNWDPDMQSLAPVDDFMRGTDYFLSARSPTRVVLLAPPCINGSCGGIDPDEVCMAWGSCRPRSFRTDEIAAIELPVGEYLDADAVVPVEVFAEGFSTDQRSGRWTVDRLSDNPVLVESPAKVWVGERWITGQRAVLRFSSGDSATPFRATLAFRSSPGREVNVHVLTTAQQRTVAVAESETSVELMLDANSVQEIVIRCESLEASFTPAPELPVCAELVGMTLHE